MAEGDLESGCNRVNRLGSKHGIADGLSCRPQRGQTDCPTHQELATMTDRMQLEQMVAWAREQKGDPYIIIVYDRQQRDTRKLSHAERAIKLNFFGIFGTV